LFSNPGFGTSLLSQQSLVSLPFGQYFGSSHTLSPVYGQAVITALDDEPLFGTGHCWLPVFG